MSNIISLILIVASFGLFFGYIDPLYTEIRTAQTEKDNLDKALANSKVYKSKKEALLKKYGDIKQTDKDKLLKLLPDHIDNVRLIIDLDEMAKNYNMRVRNFKTDSTQKKDVIGKEGDAYGTLTLSFSTTAPYNTFLAFLHDIEKSLRILDVTAIQFSSNDTDSQLYDYNVTVKTYWLK